MKAYIYPNSKRGSINNPYLDNFVKSFAGKIDFVNYDCAAKFGLLDVFLYLFSIDAIFLNWIEDVVDKKFGKIQWYIFRFIIIPVLKLRGVKFIWVLHNNISHNQHNRDLKEVIFDSFFSISDYIITHAGTGLDLIKERGVVEKAVYFHHPINQRNRYQSDKDIDILIWGSIAPYKGIHLFLDHVSRNDSLQKYNIVIAGNITSEEYELLLDTKLSPNIKLIKRFLTDEELEDHLSRSKITLFTYNKDSVLSSGALSDSIGFGNVVVGPDTGAFKDLKKEKLIYTFIDLNQMSSICEDILAEFQAYSIDKELTSDYIDTHQWDNFSEFLVNRIF